MRCCLILFAALATAPVSAASFFDNWPFSWERLNVFAFPGAAPRFMTPLERAYFTANFSNMLIWGLNASCILSGSGGVGPASCAASTCYCDKENPEAQQFVTNMEESLQSQGAALKATAAAAGVPFYPVLGYIEGLSAQLYYAAQSQLMNDPALAGLLLRVSSKGLINCYTDGCNWQGVEFRQYDLRQAAAVEFYTQQVIGQLINASGLDGTVIDVLD